MKTKKGEVERMNSEYYPSAKPRLQEDALRKPGKTIEENKEAIRQILLNKKELEKRARITITDFRSYSRAACQVLSEEGYMEAHTEEETYVPNILLGTSGRCGNGDDEDMGDFVNEDVADNADTGSTDKGKAPELTQPKVLNPMDIGSLLNIISFLAPFTIIPNRSSHSAALVVVPSPLPLFARSRLPSSTIIVLCSVVAPSRRPSASFRLQVFASQTGRRSPVPSPPLFVCARRSFRSLPCLCVPASPPASLSSPVSAVFHRMFTQSLSWILFAMTYLTSLVLASPLPQMPQTGAGPSRPRPSAKNLLKGAMTAGKWDWEKNIWRYRDMQTSSSVTWAFCLLNTHCYGLNPTTEKIVKLEHSQRTFAYTYRAFRTMPVVLDKDRLEEEGSRLWDDLSKVKASPLNAQGLYHSLSGEMHDRAVLVSGYDPTKDIEGHIVKRVKGSPETAIHFALFRPSRKPSDIRPWMRYKAQDKKAVADIPILCFPLLDKCVGHDPLTNTFRTFELKWRQLRNKKVVDSEYHPIAKPRLKETALDKKAEYEAVLLNKEELEKRTGITITDIKSGDIAMFKYLAEDLVSYDRPEEAYVPNELLNALDHVVDHVDEDDVGSGGNENMVHGDEVGPGDNEPTAAGYVEEGRPHKGWMVIN
ncbi:hypothetical protein FB446DRAFT_795427 [Lentinula raphanica]|nr:hypothetical protein FB446DRAFT_795427 [Lentinula raphanica]